MERRKKMKPKVKITVASSKEVSKKLVSLWWKLSVIERRAIFQLIRIDLLAPYLFGQKIIKDPYCVTWGTEYDLHQCGLDSEGYLKDNSIIIMDVIEEAVGVLREYLSKFDGNKYLDSMIKAMLMIRNYGLEDEKLVGVTVVPAFRLVVAILEEHEWFKHFRLHMSEPVGVAPKYRDAALVVSSMQVYVYISSLCKGENPLITFKSLADLSDSKILAEKEKGNTFFKNQNYEKAIEVYSGLLDKRPFNYVIYSNRAECYLKTRNFRLALADAKRTITLEPTSEKGQYRYCRALEQIGLYDEASKAVKGALRICPSSVHLDIFRTRIQKRISDQNDQQQLPIPAQTLSDEPPDLISGSSGDESSNYSQSEYSDESFSDICDEDYKEQVSDAANGLSDSDGWCDIEEQDETYRLTRAPGNGPTTKKKVTKQENETVSSNISGRNKAAQESGGNLWELKSEMERGTRLFLSGKYDDASFFFNLVMNLIKSGKNFSLEREDEVVLIYAYGMCSFLSGSPTDLMSAKTQFDKIIRDFSDVNFPLVHYSCGKIYHKQSRILEMRSSLNKALEIIDQSGVIIRKWPGSQNIIQETRPGELEKLVKGLLDSIGTTNADAVCRFEGCDMDKKYISLIDLDSKGFFRMKCSEFCQIEYHSVCWQIFKQTFDFKDQTPLKGFLNKKCFTPDCSGFLTYICFTFLTEESEMRNIEHKLDPIKKPKQEAKKVDKTKRMKGCSYKKLKKREARKDEKAKEKTGKSGQIDGDDAASCILDGLLAEEELCNSVKINTMDNVHQSHASLSKNPQSSVSNWMKNSPYDSLEPHSQASGLFALNDESSSQDSVQAKKKRKKKNRKKTSSDSEPFQFVPNYEPTLSINPPPGLQPMVEENPEPEPAMRDTVTEHLHSLFADLLVGKGRMNVENDEDVTDLLNILDSYSASIINSWGGLGNFLAISPTFAFDPDDRNLVYLAEEADIYLLSKKEAEAEKIANICNNSKAFVDNLQENGPVYKDYKSAVKRKKSNDVFQSVGTVVSDSKSSFNKVSRYETVKGNAIGNKSLKTSTVLPSSGKDSKQAIAKQTALWYETEKQRGIPDDVFENTKLANPVKKTTSKSKLANGLQKALQQYNIRTNSGGKGKGTNDTPMSDTCFQDFNCKLCGCRKSEKKTFDVAVMTDIESRQFKELYENEVAEKNSLFEKFGETMDNLEQMKNKLKMEKEAAAGREMELRANLEGVKSKLMKEIQSNESAQKKWQHEKEKLNSTIKSLEDKINRFDEKSYKEQLRDQERKMNKMVEKIGEMKLREESIRAENEDIISKLSSCFTEQSKRAQNAEILLMKEKKADVCKHFQKMIEQSQATIYTIEHHPFLDRNINRTELSNLWKAYNETISSNLRKCMMKFDETIQLLENGAPLDKTEPINILKNPAAPPQPQIQFVPSAAGPAHILQSMHPMGNSPPFMGMFPQPMMGPAMPVPQFANNNQHPAKIVDANSNRSAKAGMNADEGPMPSGSDIQNGAKAAAVSVPVSASSASNCTASMLPDAEEKEDSKTIINKGNALNPKANNKGGAKSTSFEKIMMKLNAMFPKLARNDLVKYLKDFREQRNNSLSGLTVDDIIAGVSQMIEGSNNSSIDKSARSREQVVKSKMDSLQFGREEPCVICHEDMVHVNNTTQLQCYHVFHSECIQRWLKQQRTCPTCRDHALLPEEFPALN